MYTSNNHPSDLKLYFYDTEHEIDNRMRYANAFLSPSKVREELERKHAFLPIRRKKEPLVLLGNEVRFCEREAARTFLNWIAFDY